VFNLLLETFRMAGIKTQPFSLKLHKDKETGDGSLVRPGLGRGI